MFKRFILVLVFLFVHSDVKCGKLPTYIKKCKLSDRQFSKCVEDNIPSVFPHLKTGIPTLDIPPLNPFKLDQVTVASGGEFHMEIKNIELYGLLDVEFNELNVKGAPDYSSKAVCYFKSLRFLGQYYIKGRLLFMQVEGHGPMNIEINGTYLQYSVTFKPKKIKGIDYVNLVNNQISLNFSQFNIHLGNLFNGVRELEDSMSDLFNDNPKEIQEAFMPTINELLEEISSKFFASVGKAIPFYDIFDP